MPLHFQSIICADENRKTELLMELLGESLDNVDSVFISGDNYIHSQKDLRDELSDTVFGRIVYTIKIGENAHEILDLDIVLNSDTRSSLQFLALREGSSDANEYYDAVAAENDGHLQIETVNRHTVEGELVDTEREVGICAFPFRLTVYEDIDSFNEAMGCKDVRIEGLEMVFRGLSERFIMPANAISGKEADDESFTFMLGKVVSFRNVRWRLGKHVLDFLIVQLDTALGVIPAAMSRKVFDLSELKEGVIIAMYADIKADLAVPTDFIKVNAGQ